jgi:transcriptional repressor NrdR
LICPNCGHADSFIVRTDAVTAGIKRRRECSRCHQRWNTYETAENVMDELSRLKRVLEPIAELIK